MGTIARERSYSLSKGLINFQISQFEEDMVFDGGRTELTKPINRISELCIVSTKIIIYLPKRFDKIVITQRWMTNSSMYLSQNRCKRLFLKLHEMWFFVYKDDKAPPDTAAAPFTAP